MHSSIAHQFGANVQLSFAGSGERQLFLVKQSAPGVELPQQVVSHGGRIILRGYGWLIAEMSLSESFALRQQPGIAFVGGVSLDPERYQAFLRVTGASANTV